MRNYSYWLALKYIRTKPRWRSLRYSAVRNELWPYHDVSAVDRDHSDAEALEVFRLPTLLAK
jgi:hypothetical protein